MTVAPTVRPIHFEDFSGAEFEWLVVAYHLCEGWMDLAWFGQTGSDQGRDIVGQRPYDGRPAERTLIQCVNRDSLTCSARRPQPVVGAKKFEAASS